KSDTADATVSLNCGHLGSTKVKVGTEWKRYTFTATSKKPAPGADMRVWVTVGFSQKGTLWINAPQFEDGKEATEYSGSPQDSPTTPAKPAKPEPKPAARPSLLSRLLPFLGPPREPVPVAESRKTSQPPKLDGALDDPCWQAALKLTNFILYDSPQPAREQTEVFLAHDSDHLYIAIRCLDSRPAALKASVASRDGQIFLEDDVEVFLSPWQDAHDYFQFAVNPLGTRFDGRGFDASWDADWQCKTGREPNAWTAEFAIPFHALDLGPSISDTWRINVCRHRANPEREEFSSWSRVPGKFHVPDRFGELRGLSRRDLTPFFVACKPEGIRCERDGKAGALVKVANLGDADRTLEVKLTLEGGTKPQSATASTTLAKNGKRFLGVAGFGPIDVAKNLQLRLAVTDQASGRLVRTQTFRRIQSLLFGPVLPLRLLPELSYITNETEFKLLAEVQYQYYLPPSGMLSVAVAPAAPEVAPVAEWEDPLHKIERWMPMTFRAQSKDWGPGEYRASATLSTVEGKAVETASVLFMKLPPKPNEVKINRFKRTLVANGRDFIPFAMGLSTSDNLEGFRDIAAHGFNSVMPIFRVGGMTDEQAKAALDLCQELGMKAIFWMHFKPDKPYAEIKRGVVRWVEMFRDHPALLAWKMVDEPEGWWEGKIGTEAEIMDLYQAMRRADPHHPVFKNHWAWKRGYGSYGGLEATDIYSVDRYPIGRQWNAMQVMADLIDDMAFDGARDGKPVAIWLQMYGSYDSPREPTVAEHRCQTYITLIHGARLIFGFIYKPMSVELWRSMPGLAEEVRTLTPIL
ncbi:MAG: hypothetical protein FJ279_28205, partial [Planctomycetes bacterium]|nr:hypothetical protein [Planctomycetota bacterium]